MEDMSAEEKAEKGAIIPAGLVNLRECTHFRMIRKFEVYCTFILQKILVT